MIMKLFITSILLLSLNNLLYSGIEQLEKYKNLLEKGTYEYQATEYWTKKPASRYVTFKQAFELFLVNKGQIMVELGTSRSFVHGGEIGCNSNDTRYWQPNNPRVWDWGAGFFTRVAAECLQEHYSIFHTVDLMADHINRCKIMTQPFAAKIQYHVNSSQNFLRNFQGKIDLLYMDTGDMTPIESTARLQLEEAQIVVQRNLIAPGGLILIDDVRNTTPKKFGEQSDYGKAKYSLEYLLANGFKIIADEYQLLLQRVN